MNDVASRDARRSLIEAAYASGIEAVAPGPAVRSVLGMTTDGISVDDTDVVAGGSLIVVAIGKAAAPMAAAAADTLGDRVSAGYVLTKDGHAAGAPNGLRIMEAAHPVPDQRGIEGTRSILDAVDGLGPDDVVLALISGGGSALFEAPVEGLTLDDIQQTTDLLLRAGAPIQHLNAVRSELSQVKGGGFRRHIGEARTVSLILSDVLGNPPDVIASGPTVRRDSNPDVAMQLIQQYELLDRVPGAVRKRLAEDRSTDPTQVEGVDDIYRIVGDNERFVSAMARYFENQGRSVARHWHAREGEAREQAVEWIEELARTDADVILGGGEMTVIVRGDGEGGRNTEFALAAAIELDRLGMPATVASLASDGQDGSVDAAGAVVDHKTIEELAKKGVDAGDALHRNDSGTALAQVDALLVPGPTGTNVNDVYIGMRHGD